MSLNVLTLGEGPPMLLLHGFSGTARTWDDHLDAWSHDHRVIAPDLLGHGGSDAETDPRRYALERQAADLADLLRLLDAAPAAVVGYSMGARIALALALEHPDLVARLVLESPSAGIADEAARARRRAADERLADALEQDGLEPFVERWEAQPLFASLRLLPAAKRERLRAERLRHHPYALAASLRGAGQGAMAPLHGHLRDIIAPTLVVAGRLDATGAERARGVAAGIPGARLAVIERAGHTPHLETPDRFAALVDEHLHATPATP